MAKRYEIIAFKGCPWCVKAYELLTADEQDVSMVWLERDGPELLQEKIKRDWATVPMVTEFSTDGEAETEMFIGGYTDLCIYLNAKDGG